MNFYQRANLNLGLAVVIALVGAIVSHIDIDNIGFRDTAVFLGWCGFQLLFTTKVLIDDHSHFSKDEVEKRGCDGPSRNFIDFFFFVVFGALLVLAAAVSRDLQLSVFIFVGALGVALLWILYSHGVKSLKEGFFWLNLVYGAVLLGGPIGFGWINVSAGLVIGALYVLYLVDVWVSKTYEIMPEG